MQEFTSSEAYVQCPQPMPVGSSIVLRVGDELQIAVRVARVSEQVAGAPRSPGMFVEAGELDAVAKAWWDGNVLEGSNASEPVPASEPETVVASEPVNASAKEDSEGPDTEVMEVVTPEEVAAAKAAKALASTSDEAAAEAPARGKKKRRRKRQTRNK